MELTLNPGKGIAFVNKGKVDQKHPDWKGGFMDMQGKRWTLSVWENTSKNNNTYISVQITPEEPPQERNTGDYRQDRSSSGSSNGYGVRKPESAYKKPIEDTPF